MTEPLRGGLPPRSPRSALLAIVNLRDGDADNVWQRIARAALDAMGPAADPRRDRHELARTLSGAVRLKRLARIGEHNPGPGVAFTDLPGEDQANWLDMADAVLELELYTIEQVQKVLNYGRLEGSPNLAVSIITELQMAGKWD